MLKQILLELRGDLLDFDDKIVKQKSYIGHIYNLFTRELTALVMLIQSAKKI